MSVAERALVGLGEGLASLAGPLWRPFITALARPLQVEEDLGPAPGQEVTLATPTALYDVERTPHPAWLGQLGGVVVPRGATLEQARDLVRSQRASRRGTPAAIIAAARSALTGTRTVTLRERDGSPWRLTLVTYAAETPDPARVLAAVAQEKPAGIVLQYSVAPGLTWDQLRHEPEARRTTWADTTTFEQLGQLVPNETEG